MYAQKGNPKENKSRAIANRLGQKKNNLKAVLGFADNRPETKMLNTFPAFMHNMRKP